MFSRVMASRTVDIFQGTRVTWTTPRLYDEVLELLNKEIQNGQSTAGQGLTKKGLSKEEFVSHFTEIQGPAGFMQFHEFDHGRWIKLFGVGDGLRLKRIILGNPLLAITMIRHDLNAGLCVPVEVLIKELGEGKGTQLVYFLPSSLITGVNKDQNLVDAVKVLDSKFERLLGQITGDNTASQL